MGTEGWSFICGAGHAENEVNIGTSIAHETSVSIKSVVDSTLEIIGFIELIATTSREQVNYISQITTEVDQISNVVQENSATAEESAASSEELTSQAHLLSSQVSKFKLADISHKSIEISRNSETS